MTGDDSRTSRTTGWNRECVICGYKWRGRENDDCPACGPNSPLSQTTVTDDQVNRALAIYRDVSEAQGPLPPRPQSADWIEALRSRARAGMRAALEDFANG